MDLNALLADAVRSGASDVHLKLGRPPMVRRDGGVQAVEGAAPLTEADLDACLRTITAAAPQRYDRFQEQGDLDLAYTAPDLPRFRVNAYRQRGATSFALRVIPRKVPQFAELGLPEGVARLAEEHRGLILGEPGDALEQGELDRKSRRLNSIHQNTSKPVICL